MPIFCCTVNFADDEKLVPITRRISTFIGPAAKEILRKRVNGFREWALTGTNEDDFVSSTAAPFYW
jgi:nicotinamidase-related amidase